MICRKVEHGYALVLGGGGSKGAYQAGVWKALKELGIKIDAVFGTSVGALNGIMIIQNECEKIIDVWQNLSIDKIVDLPEEIISSGKININKNTVSYLQIIKNKMIEYGGVNTTPLKKLIEFHLNEKKIRSSGRMYGLCAFEIDTLRPLEITLDQIDNGKLADYILASCTLPGFKPTTIDGKKYFDGGIHNNLPYSMAKERGFKKIIIVDVNGLGINKKPEIEHTETVYIKMKNDLGNILDFDKYKIDKMIFMGYYDAMKIFGNIRGVNYYYTYNKKTIEKLNRRFNNELFVEKVARLISNQSTFNTNNEYYREVSNIIPHDCKGESSLVLQLMECAAIFLKIPVFKLYTTDELIELISNEFDRLKNEKLKERSLNQNLISSLLKAAGKLNIFDPRPGEYDEIIKILINDKNDSLNLKGIIKNLIPHITGAEIFKLLMETNY